MYFSHHASHLDRGRFLEGSRKDRQKLFTAWKFIKFVLKPVVIIFLSFHLRKEADELTLPSYFTFTEYAAKEEEDQSFNGLSFDAKFFKANKEVCSPAIQTDAIAK